MFWDTVSVPRPRVNNALSLVFLTGADLLMEGLEYNARRLSLQFVTISV